MPVYSSEPLTAWLMVALSSAASSSWAAWTVTVWAVCQLPVVKVRLAGCAVTSALSLFMAITTLAVGSAVQDHRVGGGAALVNLHWVGGGHRDAGPLPVRRLPLQPGVTFTRQGYSLAVPNFQTCGK